MSNVAAEMAVKSARAHDITDPKRPRSGRNWVFILAMGWLIVVVFFVAFGRWLPFVADPTETNAQAISQGPSWDHWFGTATFGQDVFARVVEGGRISLFVGATVTFIGIFVGGLLGLLAGYLRGWVDSLVRLLISVTLSIPALLLVIFIVTIRGQSLTNVIFAIGMIGVVGMLLDAAFARLQKAVTYVD